MSYLRTYNNGYNTRCLSSSTVASPLCTLTTWYDVAMTKHAWKWLHLLHSWNVYCDIRECCNTPYNRYTFMALPLLL